MPFRKGAVLVASSRLVKYTWSDVDAIAVVIDLCISLFKD